MNNLLRKFATGALAIGIITGFLNFNPAYATNKSEDANVIDTYNTLTKEIEDVCNFINSSMDKKNVENSATPTEAAQKIDSLKEELYDLVKNNPETFPGTIISDEEKDQELSRLRAESKTDEPSTFLESWVNYGDIFVSRTSKITPSLTGHAGIGDFDKGWTIESYPDDGVRFRSRYSSWKSDATAGMYRPSNVSGLDYTQATNYAINQIGSSYNGTFTTAGSGFYCSELVYFAWKNASGLKLRTNTALGENFIWPSELADTSQTFKINWPY